MPFCGNCGADVTGAKFCGSCGTATGEQSAGAGPATPSVQGTGARGEGTPGDLGITENATAALCYLLIPAAVFLVMEPYRDSRFIRFHCFQAIFCAAAILIALGIVTTILSVVFGIMAYVLAWLIVLGSFVYGLKMVMRIYGGENVKVPIIGDFAERYA